MTFQDYLIDRHAEQYVGTDDNMPDDFDQWVTLLSDEQKEKYIEKFGQAMYLKGLEDMRELFMETLRKAEDESRNRVG